MPGLPIIVAGGGPAGLAAAFRLQRAGLVVRVLEADDRVGSKMASVPRDGFLLDRGAIFLPTTYHRLLRLAGDAGLASSLVPGKVVLGLVRERTIHEIDAAAPGRSFARTHALSRRGKLEALRLVSEAVRSRKATVDRIAEAGAFDLTTLDAWARENLTTEVRERLVQPLIRGILAAEPDEVSRVEFLGILALFAGAGMVAFADGMSAYPAHLARSLDVTLGARVLEVRQTREGANVTWADADGAEHHDSVAGCVIALNAQHARAVMPELDAWRAEYLEGVRRGSLILPNVALDTAPAGVGAAYALLPRSEHAFLGGIGFDHNKAPGRAPTGAGLLTLTLMNAWSERHIGDHDDDIAAAAIEAVERFLPGTAHQVRFTQINRWTQQYSPVGHYAKLGEFRFRSTQRDRTVVLCGEHLNAPNLNAATASGELAAAALAAALTSDGRGH